jgi:hypothetical protein
MDVSHQIAKVFGSTTPNENIIGTSAYLKKKATELGIRAPDSTDPTLQGFRTAGNVLGSLYNPVGEAGITAGFSPAEIKAMQATNAANRLRLSPPSTPILPRLEPPTAPIIVDKSGIATLPAGATAEERLANLQSDINAQGAQSGTRLLAAKQDQEKAQALSEAAAAERTAQPSYAPTVNPLGVPNAAIAATTGLPSLVSGQQPEDYSAQENFRRSEITQENATPQNQPAPVRDLSTIDTGTTQGTPAGKDKYGADFLMQLGLGMMAGKSPYALQNVGEAGLGALKSTQEQKRADTAEELKRLELAMNEKRYGAEAGKYAAETAYLNNLRGPQAAVASADKNFAEWLKLPENIGKSQAEKDAAQRLFLNRAYQGLGIIQPGSLSADDLALIQKHAGS